MKLFDYLDVRYRSTAFELQKNYSPALDGKSKAAHALVGYHRSLCKWAWMPVLIMDYLLVKSGLRRAPKLPKELEIPKPNDNLKVVK